MKKLLKALGIILLIILLIIAGICVWLFTANNRMSFPFDDFAALADADPMPASERFAFSADDDTMTMLLDKRDVCWFIDKKYGSSLTDDLRDALQDEGADLNGTALIFEDGQASLGLQIGYRGLGLNLILPLEISFTDSEITASASEIKVLGKSFPLGRFDDLAGDAGFSMEFKYDHLMLDKIDKIEVSKDGLLLTGPMVVRFMGMAREGFEAEELEKMLDDERCSYAANILYKYEENPAEGKYYWMSLLEKDPTLYKEIYVQLMSMISPQTFGGYHITEDNYGFIYRVLPDYDPLSYQANYIALAEDYK